MSYIGKTPTSVPLTSSDITDGIISLPKLTDGTDGNLISYDASGNPVAVATGSDGQVLTSTGAGSPPAFETISAESNTPSFWSKGTSATSLSNSTGTTIAVQSEGFDNGGCYNNTSSSATLNGLTVPAYSFVPNVAGLYYFTGAIKLNTTSFDVGLVNNRGNAGGTESFAALVYHRSGVANNMVMVSGFSLMNGSGNSICLYGYQTSGGTISTNNAIYTTYFGGFLVKAS